METHPVADLFPMLPDDELKDLAADIKANGLQQPIVVSDDVLIDGRNRLAACKMAKVKPSFVELNGADPVQFIISANLARRHMTKGQRAMAGIMALPQSGNQIAKTVGISQTLANYAQQVLSVDSDLADQVLAGTIPLNDAYKTVQERKRKTAALEQDRQRLRELAPDLDDQVSEEVLALTEALEQARERERVEKEERRDAVELLDRITGLVAPDADHEFLDAWANRIGTVTPAVVERTQQTGQSLIALAERMETE